MEPAPPPKVPGGEKPGLTPPNKPEEENPFDRAIDWVKGFFWGGPTKASEIDLTLPETHLEERDLYRSEKKRKTEESSFFESVKSFVEEIFTEKKPLTFSGADLERKIPEEKFNEYFVSGYNERVYDKQKANWEKIFDHLKRLGNFDRAIYEGNPMKFITDLTEDFAAGQAFEKLLDSNPEIDKAWGKIRKEQAKYFQEMVGQYYNDDPMYREKTKRYEQLNEMRNKAIDQERKGDYILWDKFNKEFEKEYVELGQYCHNKENAFFNAIIMQYNENDVNFQKALEVIQLTKERIVENLGDDFTEELMLNELHKEHKNNTDFRNALDYIDNTEVIFRHLFYFLPSEKDIEEKGQIRGLKLDWTSIGSELSLLGKDFKEQAKIAQEIITEGAFNVAEFVKRNPQAALTSGVGLTAYILGSPVIVPTYAVGALFAYHVGKKVIPPMLTYFVEEGVFSDIAAAKKDREIRVPYIVKIFAKPVTFEKKLELMKELTEMGVLFLEDLVGLDDSLIEAFYKENKTELLSLTMIVEQREPWLKILNDNTGKISAAMKIDALENLSRRGILFKEDIRNTTLDIEDFFKKHPAIKKDELIDFADRKILRNNYLFWIKSGDPLSEEQKIAELKQLHEKKLLFTQDVERLKQTEEGIRVIKRFINETGINEKSLPDITTHYWRQERSLREENDKKRSEFLAKLQDRDVKVQVEALRGLKEKGVCFKEDIKAVSEEARKEFAKEVNLDSFVDQEELYKRGLGNVMLRIGKVTVNVFIKGGKMIYNDPVNIIYGPLKGVKGTIEIAAEAMDDTFGSFLWKTTAIKDRVAKIMPTDAKLKEHAHFAMNKVVGTMKWSVFGAGVGFTIAGLFGMKIGGLIGSAYGAFVTDGRVNQIPPGGMIRAMKFTGIGALVGSLVPLVIGIFVGGLFIAGLVAAGTALTVASMGLGLLIPCLFLGAFMGYQIAGWTGKDEELLVDDPIMANLKYEVPAWEFADAFVYA